MQARCDAVVVEAGREQLEHLALALREPPGDRLPVIAMRGVQPPGRVDGLAGSDADQDVDEIVDARLAQYDAVDLFGQRRAGQPRSGLVDEHHDRHARRVLAQLRHEGEWPGGIELAVHECHVRRARADRAHQPARGGLRAADLEPGPLELTAQRIELQRRALTDRHAQSACLHPP